MEMKRIYAWKPRGQRSAGGFSSRPPSPHPGRHLALEPPGDGPAAFHQLHLTLHRGVEEQQAVQDVAGGEDLFCILKTHHTYLANAPMCVCARVVAVCGTSGWKGTISSMLLSVMKDVMFSFCTFPSSGHTKSALPSSNWQTPKKSLKHAAPPTSAHQAAAERGHAHLLEEHHSVALDLVLLEHLRTGRHGHLLIRLDQINVSEHFGLLALCILTQT